MGFNRLELLPRLLPAYRNILSRIAALGVQWVQMDEPCLAFELEAIWLEKLSEVYTTLHGSGCQLLLTTYFDAIDKHAATLKALPVEYLQIDVCRAPHQLDAFLSDYPTNKVLSLGIIDGRNVWRADLSQAFATLSKAQSLLGERLWIAPSCSLLHCLVDLQLETRLEGEIKGWLAFSVQKLNEIVILGRGLNQGKASIQTFLQESVEVR